MMMFRLAAAFTAVNLTVLLASLAQAGPSGAQASPGVLRGRALELVDERGQLRARLNVEGDGQVVQGAGLHPAG